MPVCKNCSPEKKCYYTGKENTPRGRGYAARYEKEGKRMKGTDGKMYCVKGDRWVLVKSKKRVVSPRMHQEQDLDDHRYDVFNHLTSEEKYDLISRPHPEIYVEYASNNPGSPYIKILTEGFFENEEQEKEFMENAKKYSEINNKLKEWDESERALEKEW